MTYNTRKVRLGLAFDASVYVNPDMIRKLKDAKYFTRFGYVHYKKQVETDAHDPNHWPEMMSKQEVSEHIEEGMDVAFVQRIVPEGIGGGLDYDHGYAHGDAAGWNARELGAADDAVLLADFESFEHRSPMQILDWGRGWYTGAAKHGLDPNGYFGSGLGNSTLGYITGRQLYKNLPFWKYWRAASVVPLVDERGFCCQQGMQIGDPTKWGKPGEEKHFGIFPGTPGYPKGLIIDQNMVCFDNKYYDDRKKRGRNRFLVLTK